MIHVLGSINIDYIVNVHQLPTAGETIAGSTLVLAPGGKGANQALAASRAGARVKMTGAVGTDNVAKTAVSILQSAGVDLSGVREVEGPTGCAFVFVDDDSENQIVIIAGANSEVTAEHAREMQIEKDDVLLLQLECPVTAVTAAAEQARSRGAVTVANLAPYQSLPEAVFRNIDYLILNETEARQLSEDLKLPDATVETIAASCSCAVVKTLGAKGIEATDKHSKPVTLSGINVDAIDTVGAGDTFTGYLGALLADGSSLQEACMVANTAAALSCTKAGAQPAIPIMRDVVALAKQSEQ